MKGYTNYSSTEEKCNSCQCNYCKKDIIDKLKNCGDCSVFKYNIQKCSYGECPDGNRKIFNPFGWNKEEVSYER